MNKHKFIILLLLLLIVLSGCKKATPLDGDIFKEKWSSSSHHSAISWWYLGEDKEKYFIAERWPTKETIYSITKNVIRINGIMAFQFNSGKEPVNLKNNNVEFK